MKNSSKKTEDNNTQWIDFKTFPEDVQKDCDTMIKKKILASYVFGNRFKPDQTLYEYMIEFLLIFVSAKNENLKDGKMKFHEVKPEITLEYWVDPRMALRRFIFYDKGRKKGVIPEDELAYQEMLRILRTKFEGLSEENQTEYIESIQDLFHGYAVVIKNRFWGAQALLPICPEFVLCGCDPSEKLRKDNVKWEQEPSTVDSKFSFNKRNFLARGGEVYYLHLLQGLKGQDEKKKILEGLLENLVYKECQKVSKMAEFIQKSWEEGMNMQKEELVQKLSLSFIPKDAYRSCEQFSIDELINFLSCKMHPIKRIELLAKGIMFQIMRMMSWSVSGYLGGKRRSWIVDMKGASAASVRKIAAQAYGRLEADFMSVLNLAAENFQDSEDEIMKLVTKAKKDSVDIFRAKGKEMQCIIPSRGPYERFSLSEDILRFLVLALISPGQKMTLRMFLEKLYEHYGIVIGPNEYRRDLEQEGVTDHSMVSCFVENEIAFQGFLKETGFLRELSDATSIVVNPYSDILKVEGCKK